jgi:hypothetical protein
MLLGQKACDIEVEGGVNRAAARWLGGGAIQTMATLGNFREWSRQEIFVSGHRGTVS